MGNIEKTIRYFKRNGIKTTYYAVWERLLHKDVPFCASEPDIDLAGFEGPLDEEIGFSILVPVYETKEKHLREMIESVLSQVYPNFELILADASKTDGPKSVIESYSDSRIRYVRVTENKGISENTNVAIDAATKEYCGLLDHDDLLTPDALYEMAMTISKAKLLGRDVNMIYSDEDKCDGEATRYYDRHYKRKLNLDLLLSNNYICHFTVIRTSLIKKLKFRGEYNGSQDYDMFLRVINEVDSGNTVDAPDLANSVNSANPVNPVNAADNVNLCDGKSPVDSYDYSGILYINKVLYHWRCHEDSTAFNPASKEYAYEAGERAISDFVKNRYGKELPVTGLSHKGFYKVEWGEDLFKIRRDVGATGQRICRGNKITSGIINKDETEMYAGINKYFSGHRHRIHLSQDVWATDIRSIKASPEYPELCKILSEKLRDFSLYESTHSDKKLVEGYAKKLGYDFGKEVHDRGLLFLYLAEIKEI